MTIARKVTTLLAAATFVAFGSLAAVDNGSAQRFGGGRGFYGGGHYGGFYRGDAAFARGT